MKYSVQYFLLSRNRTFIHYDRLSYLTHDLKAAIKLYSTLFDSAEYMKCYKILNVKPESDQEAVRQAFLVLVKKYHPDSCSNEADAAKFQEIDKAYRKLQQKFHAERWLDRKDEGAGEYGLYYKEKKSDEKVVQLDIKHTAPQHRQYLSYDGFGSGTPAQRHKQYQKRRASDAVESVYNHRISRLQEEGLSKEQALVVKDKQRAKNIKTRYGMDRLVEDLIQESMAKGEFDNLSGKGKPLSTRQDHYNPYVDLVTHKLNQVMIDNGYMPEWITLQKEIREDKEHLRESLYQVRVRLEKEGAGLSSERWEAALSELRERTQLLNTKIGKFNLLVPLLHNQMLLFDLEKEANEVLNQPPKTPQETCSKKQKNTEEESEKETLAGMIFSMFSR